MKKLLLLSACLLALSLSPVKSYATDPDIVVVRVQDNNGNVRLAICRTGDKTEVLTFNGGLSEKGMVDSGQGYLKVIERLYREGYSLKSTYSSAAGGHTTLVFVRETPKP